LFTNTEALLQYACGRTSSLILKTTRSEELISDSKTGAPRLMRQLATEINKGKLARTKNELEKEEMKSAM